MKNVNLTKDEIRASIEAFEDCNVYDLTIEDIERFYNDYTLTINTGRNGRDYAWVVWSENEQAAVDIETLERLTEKEIEEQFA